MTSKWPKFITKDLGDTSSAQQKCNAAGRYTTAK